MVDGSEESGEIKDEDADEEPQSRNPLTSKMMINDTATRNPHKDSEEAKTPEKPEPLNENTLLDLVFSFIGVSSNPEMVDIN